ncbi:MULTISPECIES: hypothetical protein [Leuconostoc]|uniref:Uncharacterized protein n=1 Tax=Leuconostoc pseudomesenteroides TaxID=33968 RepID=A0ABT6HB90_LEUPS|nr:MULTISPECIES: hypothetical protein [Leuconostoc]MDG9732769.1 hypothetical protein [Leuconostoc pseudomesenteroides]NKZ35570.1 hypothetical protein [Leuconostoc pseudomesenteroides]QQB28005.1 hypothetical protein I6H60_03120 [Leuconostoc pseudomesenteroides]
MDYTIALNDLRDGKIDEIKINPENFPAFQKAWALFAYQNAIRGVAHAHGQVTYVRAN